MDGLQAHVSHYGDYLVAHVLHISKSLPPAARLCRPLTLSPPPGVSMIILVAMPLFTIEITDPVLEAHESATQSYQIECSAFFATAIARNGKTACRNTQPFAACWNVIEKVNTLDCNPDLGKSYVSVDNQFYTFGALSEIFTWIIVILVCTSFVCTGLVKALPQSWNVLLELSLFFHVSAPTHHLSFSTLSNCLAATGRMCSGRPLRRGI